MVSARVVLAVVFVVVAVVAMVEAGYRKPPFNGSIFGKRASSVTSDMEVVSRALTTMCEVASETCGAWLVYQETN